MFTTGNRRSTFSRRQAIANVEKRKKSEQLLRKRFIQNGVTYTVVDVDYNTGDAIARTGAGRRDQAFHPDEVLKLLV